jgi:hypothetical protein
VRLKYSMLSLALVVVCLSAGCSHNSQVIRIFPNEFPRIAHRASPASVSGESCGSGAVFGFRLTQAPDVVAAMRDALSNAGSDYNSLARLKVYEQLHSNFLISYHCFVVVGVPLRLGQAALPSAYGPAHQVPQGTREDQWDF